MKRKLIYALALMSLTSVLSGCTKEPIGTPIEPDIVKEEREEKINTKDYHDIEFSENELIAFKMLYGEETREDLEQYFTADQIDHTLDFYNLGIVGRTIIVVPKNENISVKVDYIRLDDNGEFVYAGNAMDYTNKPFFASVSEFEFASNLRFTICENNAILGTFDLGESGMDGHVTFGNLKSFVKDLTDYMYAD